MRDQNNYNLYNKKLPPQLLSQAEALEDLKYYAYVLKTCSISFATQKWKLKTKIEYNRIKKNLLSKKTISTIDFFNLLTNLVTGIKDFHSFLFLEDNKTYTNHFFGNLFYGLISEELFIKNKNVFICQSNNSIKIRGQLLVNTFLYNQHTHYFVPSICNNKIFYRMIILKKTDKSFVYYYRNKYAFHFSTYHISSNSFVELYNLFTNKNIDYWTLPDFFTPKDQYYNQYKYLQSLANNPKKVLIIDNRLNRGGSPYELNKLLFQLFGLDINDLNNYSRNSKKILDFLDGTVIISKLFAEKNIKDLTSVNDNWPQKEKILNIWNKIVKDYGANKVSIKHENKKFTPQWKYNKEYSKKIKYSGYIILIVSKETCSLGELLYDLIYKVYGYHKIILIGSNTGGAVSFADSKEYYLKNSGIGLHLSSTKDADLYQSRYYLREIEGKGFFPDFWVQNDEELKMTLNFLTKEILNEHL